MVDEGQNNHKPKRPAHTPPLGECVHLRQEPNQKRQTHGPHALGRKDLRRNAPRLGVILGRPEYHGHRDKREGCHASPPKPRQNACESEDHSYLTRMISNRRTPPGVWTSATSPSSLLINARAIGEPILISPCFKSASSSPTIW